MLGWRTVSATPSFAVRSPPALAPLNSLGLYHTAAPNAAAARSPEAGAAFAKDVVTPVVKQFPHHLPLLHIMEAVLDKAEAAAVAENCRSRELYAKCSSRAVRLVLLEFVKEWLMQQQSETAEAAPADSASRDVAPPVAPT